MEILANESPMDIIIGGAILMIIVYYVALLGALILGMGTKITSTSTVAFVMYVSLIGMSIWAGWSRDSEVTKGALVLWVIAVTWLVNHNPKTEEEND